MGMSQNSHSTSGSFGCEQFMINNMQFELHRRICTEISLTFQYNQVMLHARIKDLLFTIT